VIIQHRVVRWIVVRHRERRVIPNFTAHIRKRLVSEIVFLQPRDIGSECGVPI
jgi:GAF domain-containing protein